MRYLIPALLLVFVCSDLFAQAPTIQWQKSLGGSGDDGVRYIHQTSDGGFIACGYSSSNDGEVVGNHGNYDVWVVKLNDTGAIEWQRSFGGSDDDGANFVQQTSDGYILTGWTKSNNDDVSGNHGDYDYWVLKLDDTGALVWQKTLGGSFGEAAYSIVRTFDNCYIIAGGSQSNDGNVTGHHGLTSSSDCWIVKINDTGAILWAKSLGGSLVEQAWSIQQTQDSGYIFAGKGGSGDGDETGVHGNSDFWVVKLNDTGGIKWQKSLGGTSIDEAHSIKQTFDGGYIIAGMSSSNDGDITGHHGTVPYDYWVVKISDSGTLQWQQSLGGSNFDGAYSILQTPDSGYVIAGYSQSTDGDVSGNHGNKDVWIVKLSTTGSILWQKSFGGSGSNAANAIQQTSDGFIAAGYSSSNDGDVSGNHGNSDYWIVKLSCNLHAGAITGLDTVCVGNNITLADTSSGGTWRVSNGHASISGGVLTGISAGLDTVYYTISNTCGSAVAAFTVSVKSCPLDIMPVAENHISLSPNPTTGIITVTGSTNNTLKVYNTMGQLLKETTGTNSVSIADFPVGLYFVRVYNSQGTLIKNEKVIKR